MDTIEIRKVRPDELPLLREISIRTFLDSFGEVNSESDMSDYLMESRSPDQLAEEFYNPDSTFYFAVADEKPIGYLKLNTGPAQIENKDRNSLEIQQIYVDRAFQNQKIGHLFLDHCFEIAKSRKHDFIWLGVWEKNLAAIRFYEKNGFEIYGSHSFLLGSDLQTDLLMMKRF